MKLKDMINTLQTANERVEIRDNQNYEICTCSTESEGWKPYQDRKVVGWFPHGAPKKDATFTVLID